MVSLNFFIKNKGLSHDQIENLVVRQLFFRKKGKNSAAAEFF